MTNKRHVTIDTQGSKKFLCHFIKHSQLSIEIPPSPNPPVDPEPNPTFTNVSIELSLPDPSVSEFDVADEFCSTVGFSKIQNHIIFSSI